ncbi:uncharacterized protein LOC121249203 [Juglans microcarpa x Juglans regia]|uniref:uncharacterized protein LOC121249203 n=1 Tax=Juglans microcarpa x Juglans regia TaxID=2249226 RepID=UPI001B7F046B|nr:uncharacterized protein LOC121249203 [Juglans microcarpa x Juglans regia]
MDKSQSLTSPPYFDGNNYAYWKVRMRAFLKSVDERVWVSITKGWREPVTIIEGVQTPKGVDNYSREEISECGWNSKGLNAIFMAVSQEEFKRISMCENCKEAWDILEVTHEGTKAVKNSKLQMLTTSFEELRMKDDETFDAFYAKLNDVVNSRFNLGDRIPENRIVRKVLRSLPERFLPKVTAIEESKDLDSMRIEELVGSLQTYEHTFPVDKKHKSIALNTIREESDESSDESAMNDREIAFYVKKFRKMFVARNNKNQRPEKKKFERYNRGSSSGNKERSTEKYTRTNKDKVQSRVQCHECHGFGHIRLECANYKKAKEKAKIASLSESESESSESSDNSSPKRNLNYMAFTTSVSNKSQCSESVSDDRSISGNESGYEDQLQKVYEKLYNECVKLRKRNKAHIEEIDFSKRENEELQSKLNEAIGLIDQKEKLDEILESGKPPGDKSGLGYNTEKSDAATTSKVSYKNERKTVFVRESIAKGNANPSDKGKKSSHVNMGVQSHDKSRVRNTSPVCRHCGKIGHVVGDCFKLKRYTMYDHTRSQSRSVYSPKMDKNPITAPKYASFFRGQRDRKENYVCHNCGKFGHIRPNCYELRRNPMRDGNSKSRREHLNLWSQVRALTRQNEMLNVKIDQLSTSKKDISPKVRKMWVRTGKIHTCHVAHIALKTRDTYMWYLDSGCSRHMSGDKSLFKTVEEYKRGTVTFGDGGKADIIGRGEIEIPGLPILREVLFVDGLKANLLSISQMCDNGAEVRFSKDMCIVSDNN